MTEETTEIRRAHEWLMPKRGERGAIRCRVCGMVKSATPSWCYVEEVPATADAE